jgi:tetratricopeptide (TPR) repeat protein
VVQTYKSDYESARASFLVAKDLDPSNPDIEINLATLDYYEGDYSGSKEKLKAVLSEYFGLAMAWNTLNQVYIAQEKYDSALYAINKALEVEQNEGIFLNNRGFTYLMLDSLETGLEDINKSILQDPDNQWAYRNKAIYYIKSNEPDLAIPYLEDLQEKNELIEDRYYYLGVAYEMKGLLDKACEVWEKGSVAELRSRRAYDTKCH